MEEDTGASAVRVGESQGGQMGLRPGTAEAGEQVWSVEATCSACRKAESGIRWEPGPEGPTRLPAQRCASLVVRVSGGVRVLRWYNGHQALGCAERPETQPRRRNRQLGGTRGTDFSTVMGRRQGSCGTLGRGVPSMRSPLSNRTHRLERKTGPEQRTFPSSLAAERCGTFCALGHEHKLMCVVSAKCS